VAVPMDTPTVKVTGPYPGGSNRASPHSRGTTCPGRDGPRAGTRMLSGRSRTAEGEEE